MDNQKRLITWGKDCLTSNGYIITTPPETILLTPWSTVICFHTTKGSFYLKQTPPDIYLSSEPAIIKVMAKEFHASVPVIIAINADLHSFIMQDAGKPLRLALKEKFDLNLLCLAIKRFAAVMRSTENQIDVFLQLGVPDWRLDKLPVLYQGIINNTDFIEFCDLTNTEVQILHERLPKVYEQCELLAAYNIPETLGYHDFHDKNVLFDSKTQKMTFADFGETAIIHPLFSLFNCVRQSITHHGVQEGDQRYQALQDACFEAWPNLTIEQQVEVFSLVKQLHPIYSILACYKCMTCLDLDAYKVFYAAGLPPTKCFREYINNL